MAWMDFETNLVAVPRGGGVLRTHTTTDVKVFDGITGAPVQLRQDGQDVTTLRADESGWVTFQALDSLIVRIEALGQTQLVESVQQKQAKGTFVGDLNTAVNGAIDQAETDGRLLSPEAAATMFLPQSQKGAPNGVASLGAAGTLPSAQVPDLSTRHPRRTEGLIYGADGRTYRLVSAVLRNTGTGWGVLEDAGHAASGLRATNPVEQLSDRIRVHLGFSSSKVSSAQVTPDETFAGMGVTCGASVGTASLDILFYLGGSHGIGDYVSFNGTAWTSFAGVFTGMTFTGGVLTLTHAAVEPAGNPQGVATVRDGAWRVGLGSLAATSTQVQWFAYNSNVLASAAANTMKAWVSRFGSVARAPVDPATVSAANGNLWLTAMFEV